MNSKMEENKKHILVVDDEEHLAVGIKFNLEAEGYRVTTASDGPKALAAIENDDSTVDLVVLDLMMPGMSGYEVCEQIRNSGRHMPVLMLSARTLSEDRTHGFDVGANQYMVKPFELGELISRIKNLLAMNVTTPRLGRDNDEDLKVYEFANVKINFQTYEITVNDQPVRLTQLQLRVLKYFIEREGVVVPRPQLLEDVWELPGHINTRAPDQVIRQLRKTFEPNPAKPVHLVTIRDAGYRFLREP